MTSRARQQRERFAAFLLATLSLSLVRSGVASADTVVLAPAQAAIVDRAAATALANVGAPGISITIARDGAIVYAKGFGTRNVANAAPFDPATIFPLGPITKQFTAAAIELLRASGKLSLDARVSTYLPKAPHAQEIRVRDLLRETSGLPEYLDGNIAPIVSSATVTPEQLLDSVAGRPLHFTPGARYEESGTNYVALGAIVEAVSGTSYGDFIHRFIALPLGLSSLTFGPPALATDLALGYGIAQTGAPVAPWTPQATYAAGGLYASETDIVKWDAAFFGDTFLPKTSVDEMTTPAVLADGTRSNFAAGSFVDTVDDRTEICQRGGIPGTSALNCWLPGPRAVVVIFANTLGFDPSEVLRAAVRAVDPDRSVPASEDAGDTARARAEYTAWENGTLDAHHYSPDMQTLIASPAAADLTKRLKAAGDPTVFAFEERDDVPGGIAHHYRVEAPGGAYDMTLTYSADGTIVQINFTRLTTGTT
jgi:D-alanyl-D-alanine carboxypeptidase